uniref:Uncharacterized protein n=2 Tax=Brassica oleracea TaxID=3712 RepID=A0A0D3CRN0_BRAOL
MKRCISSSLSSYLSYSSLPLSLSLIFFLCLKQNRLNHHHHKRISVNPHHNKQNLCQSPSAQTKISLNPHQLKQNLSLAKISRHSGFRRQEQVDL